MYVGTCDLLLLGWSIGSLDCRFAPIVQWLA